MSLTSNVLIETYWNVKVETNPGTATREEVLIETYWNVKEYSTMSRRPGIGY